jgi:hypothetical protein
MGIDFAIVWDIRNNYLASLIESLNNIWNYLNNAKIFQET